ncbi:interferon-induced, double-stranded RNA-activated protein kinase [Clupea harengus]|uniref:non-specific serine/threonine protein kinase n=1 Tax=Clupea harengus TaxID=7950 RepID=A0A8M1KNP9_CLUHA|nr:interferon-induced, double-stranded RNA-activated protein kinase [Clupea harengus]
MMNCAAKLNEYGQKTRVTVRYEEVDVTGLDHIKTFTLRAVVNGTPYPEAVGKNKKEAKENAAQKALEVLQTECSGVNTSQTSQTSDMPVGFTQANYQCWLNEYSHKTRKMFKLVESTIMGSSPYCCRYVYGDQSYPDAYGKTRKEAREEAARLVYLQTSEEQGTLADSCSGPTSRQHEEFNRSLSSPSHIFENGRVTPTNDFSSDVPQTNFIGVLNHHCQQQKLVNDFKLVEKRGPSHNPEFVYKVVIGKDQYPEGCGKTAKEARQQAAQLAWGVIQDQLPSQVSSKSSVSEDESLCQTPKTCESQDVSPASASSFIVFEDSPKSSFKVQGATPTQNKPKWILAPNFNNSPNKSIEDGPNFSTNLTGQVTRSRFEKEFDHIERIGKGGFGRVFKARNVVEDAYFAVKIVKSTEKASREVRALARLEHPNIVRYHNSWIDNIACGNGGCDSSSTPDSESNSTTEFLYIRMELCESNTLSTWIKERNKHPDPDPHRRPDALDITKQIVKAVVYIHSQQLIHRDLKPTNIMFGRNGEVKIGDFGLVTAADSDNDESLLERTKRTGTVVYMSPEQMNQSSYDRKVDIFSLGLIYFELLWKMFTKVEKYKILDDVRKNTFPQEFCDQFSFEHKLIERMLCPDALERPDAQDLVPELENFKSFQDQNCNQRNTNTIANGWQKKEYLIKGRTGISNFTKMCSKEKILSYFEGCPSGASYNALQIAKAVGLKTTKDVNGVLYGLKDAGQLHVSVSNKGPPLWSLQKKQVDTPEVAERQLAKEEQDLMRALKTDGEEKGMTAVQIAKNTNQEPKSVKKMLYNLRGTGKVEKLDEKVWKLTGSGKEVLESGNRVFAENLTDKPESGLRFSRDFDLVKKLGEGGYGCVCQVKHKLDGKFYAMKIVDYDQEAEREVRALAICDHPNIVRYSTAWTEVFDMNALGNHSTSEQSCYQTNSEEENSASASMGDLSLESESESEPKSRGTNSREGGACLFIQMEFCEKGTLSNWLEDRNFGRSQKTREDALRVFQQVVCGVEYIHSKGLIHRDLKPDNILFTNDNCVKIGDFGLVTSVTNRNGGIMKRTVGKGTESYMSPEQMDQKTYDEKTDIFPLGLICFELLWKISTYTERGKIWPDLRNQVFPTEFSKAYSSEVSFCPYHCYTVTVPYILNLMLLIFLFTHFRINSSATCSPKHHK